jgi:streptogramin lyase
VSHGPRGLLRRPLPIGPAVIALAFLVAPGGTSRVEAAPPNPITEFALTPGSLPIDITAGPDGNLWFTEFGTGGIGRITTAGVVSEFAAVLDGGFRVKPVSISRGADDNLWFTYDLPLAADPVVPGVAAMNRFGSVLRHYDFPLPYHNAKGIASGLDGSLWIAVATPSAILKMTTTGSFTPYPLPDSASVPNVIRDFGTFGHYFTEQGGQALASLTLGGALTEYPIAPAGDYQPVGFALGSTGFWISESHTDQIGLMNSRTLAFTHYPLAAGAQPWGMVGDAFSGGAWFCEFGRSMIGHIRPGGGLTEYPTPTSGAGPRHIVLGSDGDGWFTESLAGKIGHISIPGPPKLPG